MPSESQHGPRLAERGAGRLPSPAMAKDNTIRLYEVLTSSVTFSLWRTKLAFKHKGFEIDDAAPPTWASACAQDRWRPEP